MSAFAEVLAELRRPFTPAAVKWKLQVSPKPGSKAPGVVVGFIDARLVAERLNAVAVGDWSDEYGPITVNQSAAFITCRLNVMGAVREDVGWSNGCATDMAAKTVYSDAFKRAAVKFGCGAFLYALPEIKLWQNELDSFGQGDKQKWRLSDANRTTLTQRYTTWTENPRIVERFGNPMDHGDQARSEVPA